MSNPTTTCGSSISQHLRTTKRILQDAIFNVNIATTQDRAEVDALERDAFEVLRLIRSWKNTVAPINKIPPEILTLVPDYWYPEERDEDVIALTHVCRAWREVFLSRSSLWTYFDCMNEDQTRVYLERSKSSPITLSLYIVDDISPRDPFFQITPQVVGRVKFLSIETTPENLQAIVTHLSHPDPLLEELTIYGDCRVSNRYPTLAPSLFNGDLSSLRALTLDSVRTKFPWRSMTNLTSFTLTDTPLGEASIGQLLDFFEGAPHLRDVDLHFVSPMTGAQNGRLVSLVCLKSMLIEGRGPSSVLLNHLVIPVGADLETKGGLFSSLIGEHLPRSLDNLKNLFNFTTIQFYLDEDCPRMKFSGPNGKVTTVLTAYRPDRTELALESLAQLDTSKTERLEINRGYLLLSGGTLYRALIPMTDLRTLTLSKCVNPHTFVRALHPGIYSPDDVVVCPKLEELVLRVGGEKFNVRSVVEMAAARACEGKKLGTIRIVDGQGVADLDLLELREFVWNVEYSPRIPVL